MTMCQTAFNDLRYQWPRPKNPHLFEKLFRIEIGPRDNRIEAVVTGKYKSRAHKYETSQFEFDLNTCEAYSYGWWQFVKRVKNTIYVNDYSYSKQTDMHQAMAENILMCELPELHGLKIKRVSIAEGLNRLDRAISNRNFEIIQLKGLIAKPRSQTKANANRLKQIKQLEKKILELKKMQSIFNTGAQ